MSKYRIITRPFIWSVNGGVGEWFLVQKKILGLFWYTLEDTLSEEKARKYLSDIFELKKSKVRIIDVVEEG